MPKILSCVNLKGGVGKTALAVNFSAYCGSQGKRTLLIDLWEAGRHRLAFHQIETYFSGHPALEGIPPAVHCVELLSTEYSTLSRAVHGSAVSFRMSASDTGTQLWSDDVARVGKYESRQKATLIALNQLLLCLFRDHLQGAVLANLRKAVSFAIPAARHRQIKTAIGVSLMNP